MSLIMTIDDDDDDDVVNPEDDESDDGDFIMGGAGTSTDDIYDPSTSGKWQTAHARTNLKKKGSMQDVSSLDEKIAARASKAAQSSAPALRPEEAAGDAVRDRKSSSKKERKMAAAAAAKAAAAEEEEEGASDPITAVEASSFDALKLCKPLLKAVWELGFVSPTPIQTAVIPKAMRGVDICASAVTGSGKTAAFLLPALERLVHRPRRIAATRVLVLCPTRELAAQCDEMGRQLSKFTDVRFTLIVGGLSSKSQEAELRSRPDVIVATPGRLIDLLRNSQSVGIDELEILILDEADRMLDVGFEQEVSEIVKLCPPSRQTMLFSATITSNVAKLAALSLDKPLQIKVDALLNVADNLSQEFVRLRPSKEHEREAVLLSLVTRTFTSRTIVFLASKKHAHRVHVLFGLFGLKAAELHGNLTQVQRLQSLDDFREGKVDFLLATDLAGRGLDIRGVATVINYDLPHELKTYIHRVGRTARAGAEGRAVSIVAERDRAFLKQVRPSIHPLCTCPPSVHHLIPPHPSSSIAPALSHTATRLLASRLQVLKHASDTVKTRTVPPESIMHWVDKLGACENTIKELMLEEEEEKAIRVAEMEANKASNIMAHREEIMARPARSWFQTETEKLAVKEASKRQRPTAAGMAEDEDGDGGRGGGGGGGDSRKKPKQDSQGQPMSDKPKVKRDPNAGLSRMQRRRREREGELKAHFEERGVSLPNQKANASGAKAAAKRAAPSGITAGLLKKQAEQREKAAERKKAAGKKKGGGGGSGGGGGGGGGGADGAGLATARSPGAVVNAASLAGLAKSGGDGGAKAKGGKPGKTIAKKVRNHSKPKFSKARKRT